MHERPLIFFSRRCLGCVPDVWDRSEISRGSFQHFGLGQVGDQVGDNFSHMETRLYSFALLLLWQVVTASIIIEFEAPLIKYFIF